MVVRRMTNSDAAWVRSGDIGYDHLRKNYNEAHETRPSVIAPVRTVKETQAALSYARSEGLAVAVRGGGHSIAGLGGLEGGLVIDVRGMNQVEPAEQPGQFWIGGGALAGDVSAALGRHGLVVPLGDSPGVGIGGITLGGGIGLLVRKFGLSLDSLTAAEIVTSDGSISVVHEQHQPDLFWALRGGGGNFGVVTRLRFQPRELGQVLGGTMVLPLTVGVLERFVASAAEASDDLSIIALAMRPPGSSGAAVLSLTLVWSGDLSEGQSALSRLRAIAAPMSEDIQVRSYADMYRLAEGAPASITNTTETLFADELDAGTFGAIVDAAIDPVRQDVLSAIEIRVLGGAMARVAASATAFAHRDRKLLVSVVRAGFPREEYAEHRAWVGAVRERLKHLEKGRYLNFIERLDATDFSMVYPGDIAARLVSIKRAVDPENLFSQNLPLPREGTATTVKGARSGR